MLGSNLREASTSAESSSISTNSKSGTVGAPLRISEEELALRFTPRLRLFAARQLNDSAGAEDVTQEVLRLVIEAIRGNRIDNQEALPGFVFQTARNVCMHWVRSRLREKTAFARYERESTEESSGSDALESLVSAERAQEVKRALGRLHPDDRQLLAMIYYDEFDTADIARRYNITPAALRVRKHRALQRLSAELELAGNESGKAGTL